MKILEDPHFIHRTGSSQLYNQPQWFPGAADLQLRQPEVVHTGGMRESEDGNLVPYYCLKKKKTTTHPLFNTHIHGHHSHQHSVPGYSISSCPFLASYHHTLKFILHSPVFFKILLLVPPKVNKPQRSTSESFQLHCLLAWTTTASLGLTVESRISS